MFAAANMAAQKPPGGFLQGVFWSRAGSSVTLHPYCAPAPGRLFAARQRKFCQRRLAARGQVDSTGPRAIIQRSQLCLLRQRWLPCAKGAVGERRLKDWQRGGSPQPPLCKGGTAWQGHAGGIVKPHCIQPAFSTAHRQDCRAAFPGVGSPAPEQKCQQSIQPGRVLAVRTPDPASRWHGTHAGKNRSTS